MAEQKTKPTDADVAAFLAGIEDERQRADSQALARLMEEITGERPTLWGPSMVGFGQRHYRYASGHEGDTFVVGFAPRKAALTLYLSGYLEAYQPLLARLGKHKVGKGCLYVQRLSDVDVTVLREVIQTAVDRSRHRPEE